MIEPEIKEVSKDHYQLIVNGINVGILERSQVRYLIGKLDNEI